MKKKLIMGFTVILIAAGIIFIPSLLMGKNNNAFPQPAPSNPVFTVRTENAEIRTLVAYIEVNANIVSENQVAVMPDAAGRLVSMLVGLGEVVQRGDLVAEVDPSRPGTTYSLSPVYAPVSGMVVTVPQTVGTTVSTSTALMTIAVDNSVEIEALIPEREIGQLRTGLQAEVKLEAFPGETFAATLTQVSPVVDPVSRTKKITLRFNPQANGLRDSRINPGMFVRVRLNTRTYRDVVSIPYEALVDHRGQTVVYVLDDGETIRELSTSPQGEVCRVQMREVDIGVNVDGEVEIKSGVMPGEVVVVQGHQLLTDGAPVRVIGRLP